MNKQMNLSALSDEMAQVQTKKKEFLEQIERREHEKSSVRTKVEHVFGVVTGLLRYRKRTAKLNMMFALANLILADDVRLDLGYLRK